MVRNFGPEGFCFMDNSKLELLNLCTDLKRSVMFLVRSQNNNSKDCTFIQNILKNYPNLIKIDPKISEFIDIDYLKKDIDPPKVKAEFLLMMSNRLQHHLGF